MGCYYTLENKGTQDVTGVVPLLKGRYLYIEDHFCIFYVPLSYLYRPFKYKFVPFEKVVTAHVRLFLKV